MGPAWLVLTTSLVGAGVPARPLYYDRPITAADLDGRSLRELALLRNTLYARVGNPFRKRWLHAYFAGQSWYHELPAPQLEKLSEIDKANAALLEKVEASVPREELLRRRTELLARHHLDSEPFQALVFVPQGVLTATSNELSIWSVPEGRKLASAKLPPNQGVRWAIERPDGSIRLVLAGSNGVALASWTPGRGVEVGKPMLRGHTVDRAMIPATGEVALVISDGELDRLDFGKRQKRKLSEGVTDELAIGASASVDGRRLTVATTDGEIFSIEGKPQHLPGGLGFRDWGALSPNGAWMVATAAGHKLRRASMTPGAQIEKFPGQDGQVLALAATDDGQAFEATSQAVARLGPEGAIWRLPLPLRIDHLAVGDGWLAVTAADHSVRLIDVKTGTPTTGWNGPSPLGDDDAVELVLLSRALGEKLPAYEPNDDVNRNPLDDVELLDQLLAVSQLKDLSRRDLKLLRHTISARHGKAFTVSLLHDYFATKRWYRADAAFDETRLTEIDRKNLKIVGSLEEDLGGPLPDNLDHEIMFRG